jgi:hypothetical protein
VSILASVEKPEDLVRAHKRGYAAAIVVNWFPYGPRAYSVTVNGEKFKVVPCPEQSMPGRGIGCKDCGLCMKDQWLRDSRTVIGIAAHGPGAGKVREKLVRIGEDQPGEGKLWEG